MTRDSSRAAWFFAAALSWTWIALAIALISGASATEPPTSWLRLAAGVGPLVATAVLLHHDRRLHGERDFWRRLINLEPIGVNWWAIITVASAGPGVAVWLLGGQHDFGTTGAGASFGIVAFALAAAFAEEPGWRGYALDRLRDRPLRAAVLIASVWAIWHLPLYAIDGTFQHDDVGFATAFFWIIQASFLPQTVLMIWILDHTRSSILPAIAFHALVNISGEILDYSTRQQATRLVIWVALALAAATRLHRSEPHRSTSAALSPASAREA